jgi:ribosomal protein S18 acetylase RimI-like enzyme
LRNRPLPPEQTERDHSCPASDVNAIGLDPGKRSLAAAVFSRAFFDYPTVIAHWPDPSRRARSLDRYLACTIEYGLRYGEVYTTPDVAGIAIWLPPGQTRTTTWRYIRSGYFRAPTLMGLGQFLSGLRSDDQLHEVHGEIMKGPHWYLWALAVDPEQQNKGIGTALLRQGTEKAQAQHIPCYLETHAERNLPFFGKARFDLVRVVQVTGSDLRLWAMVREPSVSSDLAPARRS